MRTDAWGICLHNYSYAGYLKLITLKLGRCQPAWYKKISEIVREKIFNKTSEEIPHSLTCIVEHIETKKDKSKIDIIYKQGE